jgi:hypothetical protein
MKSSDEGKTLLWNPTDEEASTPPPSRRIPYPHYAAIGKVIDAWGDLEFEVDRVIWDLMGVKQPFGACVTSQIISVQPKLRALRALLHLWGADALADEVGSFAGGMYELSELRNRIVHDKRFILHPNNDVVRFEITTPKKLTFYPKIETKDDLAEFVTRINQKRILFDDIREKIRDMRDASPGILQQQFLSVVEARDYNKDQTTDAPPPSPPLQPSQE